MNTIATWFERKEGTKKDVYIPLDVHVNFWKLFNRKRKKSDYFIDLGFMIHDITVLSNFHIHFPFIVKKNDLQDIGVILHNNKQLVNSVFNENYHIHNGDEPKQISVQDGEKKTIFNIYSIDFESDDCEIVDKWDGSCLTINLSQISLGQDCSKYYFRLRLKGDVVENFRREQKPQARYFQSAFTITETIDFRLNEKRNYHSSLSETIKDEKQFKIEKIHFLLLRSSSEDFESKHINANCRELEPELWANYVTSDYDLENILAYHWSEKMSGKDKWLDSFNTLVKIKYNKTSKLTIAIYILLLGFLSIAFNLTAAYIKDGFANTGTSTAITKIEKEQSTTDLSTKKTHDNDTIGIKAAKQVREEGNK